MAHRRILPFVLALPLLTGACAPVVSGPPYGVSDPWETRSRIWGSPFGYADPFYDPFDRRDPFYDDDDFFSGDRDPFYGSGFSRRRSLHERFHDRLRHSHREGHQSLRKRHADAHRRPLTKEEHRLLHRDLRREHQGLHHGLRSGHRSGHRAPGDPYRHR